MPSSCYEDYKYNGGRIQNLHKEETTSNRIRGKIRDRIYKHRTDLDGKKETSFPDETDKAVQDTLDALDKNLTSLDNLKHQNTPTLCTANSLPPNGIDELGKLDLWLASRRRVSSKASTVSRISRQTALEDYLRDTIKDSDECSCHFEHKASSCSVDESDIETELPLLRQASSAHKELDERATSSAFPADDSSAGVTCLASEIHPLCTQKAQRERNCSLPIEDEDQIRCGLASSSSHGLFIEAFGLTTEVIRNQPGRETNCVTTEFEPSNKNSKAHEKARVFQFYNSGFYCNKLANSHQVCQETPQLISQSSSASSARRNTDSHCNCFSTPDCVSSSDTQVDQSSKIYNFDDLKDDDSSSLVLSNSILTLETNDLTSELGSVLESLADSTDENYNQLADAHTSISLEGDAFLNQKPNGYNRYLKGLSKNIKYLPDAPAALNENEFVPEYGSHLIEQRTLNEVNKGRLEEASCNSAQLGIIETYSDVGQIGCLDCLTQEETNYYVEYSSQPTLASELECYFQEDRQILKDHRLQSGAPSREGHGEEDSTVSNFMKNHDRSMKPVKEIFKVSTPSLSALQYLPNQIESNRWKRSGSFRIDRESKTANIMADLNAQKKARSMQTFCESKENLSQKVCLLHRICLCNCLASNHDERYVNSKTNAKSEMLNRRERTTPERVLGVKNDASVKTETASNLDVSEARFGESKSSPRGVTSSAEGLKSGQEPIGKQHSPKFLNLLLSPEKLAKRRRKGIDGDSTKSGISDKLAESLHPQSRLYNGSDPMPSPSRASFRESNLERPESSSQDESNNLLRISSNASPLSESLLDDCDTLKPASTTFNSNPVDSVRSQPFLSSRIDGRKSPSFIKYLSPSGLFTDKSVKYGKKTGAQLTKNEDHHKKQKESYQFPDAETPCHSSREQNISIIHQEKTYDLSDPIINEIVSSGDRSTSYSEGKQFPTNENVRSHLSDAPVVLLNHVEYLEHSSANGTESSNEDISLNCPSEPSPTDPRSSQYISNSCFSLPISPYRSPEVRPGRSRSPRLTKSPVPFTSPANQSSKIEDGLKVCSTEHFEKHIGNIKNSQMEAQERLFKAWINHHCPGLIKQSLVNEVRDGIKLIGLLGTLNRDAKLMSQYHRLSHDKQSYMNRIIVSPTSRLSQLSNVSVAIEYMRKNLGMRLINLNPMDIVAGKPNVILGLCWNIILNFQLDSNSNEPLSIEGKSEISQSKQSLTSDCEAIYKSSMKLQGDVEEYSHGDLGIARKKLIEQINRQFGLRLTNLSSNLLDGEVLSLIIERQLQNFENSNSSSEKPILDKIAWKNMSHDEKLNHCFDIAETYLGIPKLFNANDIQDQYLSDNNSKTLLIYLSMLLKSKANEPSSRPSSVKSSSDGSNYLNNFASDIRSRLEKIDTEDRYELQNLHSTLFKIEELSQIFNASNQEDKAMLDRALMDWFKRLKGETSQIELLISWINEADNLLETTCKSSTDLMDTIERYRKFFSDDRAPQLKVPLCPSLERQYGECLSTAKQRLLLMEQTLKNWNSYDNSLVQLKEWLSIAERKLSDALCPIDLSSEDEYVSHFTSCLEDLIVYFDLEPSDTILNSATKVPSLDSLPSKLLATYNDADSDTNLGSVQSLGSISSTVSTLQSSRKANYIILFDDFELKCRLLAAGLDSEQRDTLLLVVKKLKSRLKFIIEQRVPQVLGELRLSINQLASAETQQSIEDIEEDVASYEPTFCVSDNLPEPDVKCAAAHNDCEEERSLRGSREATNLESEKLNGAPRHLTRDKGEEAQKPVQSSGRSKLSNNFNKRSHRSVTKNKNHKRKNASGKDNSTTKTKNIKSAELPKAWSMFDWFFGGSKSEADRSNHVSPKRKTSLQKNQVKQELSISGESRESVSTEIVEEISRPPSFARLLWDKIVRTSKASLSFNVVLLVCLAGICMIPYIQRDVCCELTNDDIPVERFTFNPKPV